MLNTYHCERMTYRLQTIIETPEAALLQDPRTGKYYIDYSDGTDVVEECADALAFDELRNEWIRITEEVDL